MKFKDKINAIETASMTPEELFSEFGITEEEYVTESMKKVRKQRFLAMASAGRAKEARLANRIRALLQSPAPQSNALRSALSANPAFSFRNLDKMTDVQLIQIAKDMAILDLLDSENE